MTTRGLKVELNRCLKNIERRKSLIYSDFYASLFTTPQREYIRDKVINYWYKEADVIIGKIVHK